MKMRFPGALFSILFALLFVLAGCDFLDSEETVILNSDSPIPPTVEYTFEYTSDDVNSDGWVEVTSEQVDNLGAILSENGFSRDDVVSAEIDRVVLRGLSPEEQSTRKIYEHVQRAEVYFPGDASSVAAEGEVQTTQGPDRVELNVVSSSVTSAVEGGAQNARLELETQEDGFSELHRAEAEIFFEIEVEGV